MAASVAVSEIPELVQGKIPVELYLRCSDYEPDAEFVDGFVEERPMGEYGHSSWQHALEMWFGQHEREWNIRVRPELRVQISSTRYRVPDVVVFDRSLSIKRILVHTPIAVFEVLSPEDRTERVKVKLEDYRRIGIQTIVVIDPETEPATLSRYREGSLVPITEPVTELPGSVCSVDWTRVREFLD